MGVFPTLCFTKHYSGCFLVWSLQPWLSAKPCSLVEHNGQAFGTMRTKPALKRKRNQQSAVLASSCHDVQCVPRAPWFGPSSTCHWCWLFLNNANHKANQSISVQNSIRIQTKRQSVKTLKIMGTVYKARVHKQRGLIINSPSAVKAPFPQCSPQTLANDYCKSKEQCKSGSSYLWCHDNRKVQHETLRRSSIELFVVDAEKYWMYARDT